MDIKELKGACDILGLDFKEFVEVPEIEKGVTDYKAAYEQQKALNEKILGNIGEISKSFESKLQTFQNDVSQSITDQLKELKKSFGSLEEEVNGMKKSPMRQAKSATKVNVIEKAVNQNNGVKTYSLSDMGSVRELKKYLGDKAIEDLQKGINNGLHERASLQDRKSVV